MSEVPEQAKKVKFKLANRIIGSVELRRILRELQNIDDFLYQANLRAPGSSALPPKTTKLLEDLFSINSAQILDPRSRANMLSILKQLETKAPVLHVSFAVESNQAFNEKIVAWVRENIHSYALVNIGLQPSVIVGCNLRSTNKVFDMSLRSHFANSKYILNDKIEKMADTEVKDG